MTPLQRERVAAEAITWLGTPYHHHGRVKRAGVDCAQILCAVYEACGLVPPIQTGHYPTDWHFHRSEEIYSGWLEKYCEKLGKDDPPLVGDIALFRFGRCFSHGAILIGDGLVIHAYIGRGVILSNINEEPLDGRAIIYWRVK